MRQHRLWRTPKVIRVARTKKSAAPPVAGGEGAAADAAFVKPKLEPRDHGPTRRASNPKLTPLFSMQRPTMKAHSARNLSTQKTRVRLSLLRASSQHRLSRRLQLAMKTVPIHRVVSLNPLSLSKRPSRSEHRGNAHVVLPALVNHA